MLIAAKAPLDHVNNLKWTALIESIVLGDGGRNHTETLRALVDAGANVNLADGSGIDAAESREKPRLSRDGCDPGKGRREMISDRIRNERERAAVRARIAAQSA